MHTQAVACVSSEAEINVYSIASAGCTFLVLLGAVPLHPAWFGHQNSSELECPTGQQEETEVGMGPRSPWNISELSSEAFQNQCTLQQALLSSEPQFRPVYNDMSLRGL